MNSLLIRVCALSLLQVVLNFYLFLKVYIFRENSIIICYENVRYNDQISITDLFFFFNYSPLLCVGNFQVLLFLFFLKLQ